MLSLKQSLVQRHWQVASPRLSKVFSVMEHVEHWVVDEAESVSLALNELSKTLNDVPKEKFVEQKVLEKLLYIMSYVSCSKAMRIMNWFDEKHAGLSLHYMQKIKSVEDWQPASLMLDRMSVVVRISLMAKVFAPSRSRLITEILKN